MPDYKIAYEILGMVGTRLEISKLNEETFSMACEIYPHCIPTQVSEGEKARFEKIPKKARENKDYLITGLELKELAHWLYKRCEPNKKNDYKAYYNSLCSMINPNLLRVRKSIQDAITHFDSSKSIPEASELLGTFWESAAFTACTLFLSSFFPDKVSFLSPELIRCFNLNEKSGDETLYTQLEKLSQTTIERIEVERRKKKSPRSDKPISRIKLERVAYVLCRLIELEDTYYDPDLVDRGKEIHKAGIFKAEAADCDNNRFKGVAGPLAMKEVSVVGDRRLIDYLVEIGISSRQKHPNIIAFHGWTYKLRHIRIVMDLMKTDLEKRLKNRRTWITRRKPAPGSSRLLQAPLQQLLQALQALHEEAITHRDIKPQNIFLDKEDNIVLGDFGVSRQARDGIKTTLETLTGTAAYIAPEVLIAHDQNQAYTPKADGWAVGCVLFRMIFGYPLIRPDAGKDKIVEAVEKFKNGNHQEPDRQSESSDSSDSSETGHDYSEKDLGRDQRLYLCELIDCEESTRLSVSDALSQCHSVWHDY